MDMHTTRMPTTIPSRCARSAAAGFLILVAACSPIASGGPTPRSAEPGASAVAPSPAASPVSSPAPSALGGWQRSPDQLALVDAGLQGVIWSGSQFLAIAGVGSAMILDSAEGLAWHRQPAFETNGWNGPTALAAGAGRVLAVGGGSNGPVAIWYSADGLAWTAAPDQDAFRSRDGAFQDARAVIATDDGWLAVGGEFYNCTPRCPLRALVLTSRDGVQWMRLPETAALLHAEMSAIARGPSGYIAVGTVMVDPDRGEAGMRAAAWTSPDGRDWTRIGGATTFDVPAGWAVAGPTDVVLRGIAVSGDRVVVMGDVRPAFGSETTYVAPLAVAWWTDGGAWAPVELGLFADDRELAVSAVLGGFLAITGTAPDCLSGMRESTDGVAWRCVGLGPAFTGYAVLGAAASPDVEVLVGRRVADPLIGAAWTRSIP